MSIAEKMTSAFTDILDIPFDPKLSGPDYEGVVKGILEGHFPELPSYSNKVEIPDGVEDFICWQPNGSQSAPDFWLSIGGKVLSLEIKSSKTGKPMWNSGYPRPGMVYVLISKQGNTATLGDDLSDPETVEILTSLLVRFQTIKEEVNNDIFHMTGGNPKVVLEHVRPAYKLFDNRSWIKNPERESRMLKAFEYVSGYFGS